MHDNHRPTIAVFPHLNNEQAHGHMCVVCHASFVVPPAPDHVPVGTSATGSQVFACETKCAPLVGYVAPIGERLELGAGR